ncbi:MAG: DUF4173 domain-containing protein [Prevotellaceae bacterium]|jgi:hypothetical protein|nr:DUF4173 domain-containing protein [Prevotellaceae bacterium]
MKNVKLLIGIIVGAAVYRFLMWNETLGLNAFIFAVLITGAVFAYKQELRRYRLLWTLAGAFVVSAAGVAITGIVFSHTIYYLTLIVFLAFVQMPSLRSPWCALLLLPYHSAIAIWMDINLLGNALSELFGKRPKKPLRTRVRWWQVAIISMAAIVFIWLFSVANPQFAEIIRQVWQALWDAVAWVIPDLSFLEIVHYLFVMYFLSLFVLRFKPTIISKEDERTSDHLHRIRHRQYFPYLQTGLKSEYHTVIAGILVISALLLTLNVIDIVSVWIAIAPESAPELSQFVHRSTYALMVSVIFSISILLFCFRKNLNFYPRNRLLKVTAYSWIGQNVFLLCSTGLRNWHYVSEYGLTYRRIGVFIFLLMVCVSLLLIFLKIRKRRTLYHFFRMNIFGALGVLVIAGLVNWDLLIASYNTSHIEKETDYAYLERLSYQTAPYILHATRKAFDEAFDKDADENIDGKYRFDNYWYSQQVYKYVQEVDARSWKSFTVGDACTVRKLKAKPFASPNTAPFTDRQPTD